MPVCNGGFVPPMRKDFWFHMNFALASFFVRVYRERSEQRKSVYLIYILMNSTLFMYCIREYTNLKLTLFL